MTFAREICHLGIKMKKNMKIVLLFCSQWQTARVNVMANLTFKLE